MDLPPFLFTRSSSKGERLVCKLTKFLYGLKQASRQWFAKIFDVIPTQGFVQAVLVYVDDILVASNDVLAANQFKKFLHDKFKLKELDSVKYFLGLGL